jgi:glycerol-3-phosphate dehydrogenase
MSGAIRPGLVGAPETVDLLVVGLGVTGAGVALDAATRGLSVLAVDAHDLAFGTSRFSSKLVHGGLRYLAHGQLGVAHESAVERGILMETTAPHLTRALPSLIPLGSGVGRAMGTASHAALWAGDLLRRGARTSADTLPAPRRLTATEALRLAPDLRADGLRGALLGWDGQLEDDARLVTTIARTAAQHGAQVRTRARVLGIDAGRPDRTVRSNGPNGPEIRLRDELTGTTHAVRARAVVNAAGVWAGELAPDVRLRPSRGTHLVLRAGALAGLRVAVFAPVPGERNRFVLVLPQPDGRVLVGLTDEPVDGPVPDVARPTEVEIGFLLDVVSATLSRPLRRSDVAGAFAGLRPLLDTGDGATSDLSRQHAVLTSGRTVTVVGGKLTTYRRMAEDAVDAAVAAARLEAGPCRTARLPLAGAAPRGDLAELADAATRAGEPARARLLRRYGVDADLVVDSARALSGLGVDELLAPSAPHCPVTLAELVFGVTHEGAADVDDLLDRRTRVGLVPGDRPGVVPAAERALRLAGAVV